MRFLDKHPNAVLLLVDLQNAIDDPSWGSRNNPSAENVGKLVLETWRAFGAPVWHVRHNSIEPGSHYRPGQPGNDFKPEFVPRSDERVFAKMTNSAFIGTDLEMQLRDGGHETVVIAGVITNNSVEATVRMSGNLGFETYVVADACFTFDQEDWSGRLRTAEEVHAMSLGNLDGEYCTVVTATELLA